MKRISITFLLTLMMTLYTVNVSAEHTEITAETITIGTYTGADFLRWHDNIKNKEMREALIVIAVSEDAELSKCLALIALNSGIQSTFNKWLDGEVSLLNIGIVADQMYFKHFHHSCKESQWSEEGIALRREEGETFKKRIEAKLILLKAYLKKVSILTSQLASLGMDFGGLARMSVGTQTKT